MCIHPGRCTWSWNKERMWTFGETWQPSQRMRSANWGNWKPLAKDPVRHFPVSLIVVLGPITDFPRCVQRDVFDAQAIAVRESTQLWVQMCRLCSKERHMDSCRRCTSTSNRRFGLEGPILILATGRVCCSKSGSTWPEQGINVGPRFVCNGLTVWMNVTKILQLCCYILF